MPLWKRKEIQEVLRTPKRIIPLVIVLFWLVMMGGLLYREVALPYWYRGTSPARVMKPQNIWLGLYFGEEQRVGFVHLRTTPEDREFEEGYAMNVLARLEFPLFGQNARFQLSGNAWQSTHDGLREFSFTLDADEHTMRIEGVAEEGSIKALLHTGGETTSFSLPVGRNVLLSGGMGLGAVSIPAMTPGETVYLDAFDPTTMSVSRARLEALRYETLEVAGEFVETMVVATTVGPVTTRVWVSPDEEVVRAETPFGLIIKKITPDDALAPTEADKSANIIRALSVTPEGAAPNPDADILRLRITATPDVSMGEKYVAPTELLPPEDNRQWYEDGLLVVVRQDPDDPLQQRPMKVGAKDISPLSDSEKAPHLASDLFIQAEHPRIRQTAQSITADATTPWEKAARIFEWMYENLEKEHVLSVPSALEVLDQLQGDCNEHAVLFAALARAVDIPTRIVIGLAWSDKMQAFGYHAWVEVYVGQWIAMDPTFGEKTVSPTHIKLITGGIDQWPQLLPYIGALAIEVVTDDTETLHVETVKEEHQ